MTVINTNTAALRAQNGARMANKDLRIAMERLSTGKRINSAKGDAAGLAIASSMTASIRGMNQAIRNAYDGISMAQTAEGALGEAGNMLQRIRELAVQSASGTYSDGDRTSLQAEVAELGAQVSHIVANTRFNDLPVFSTTDILVAVQTGAESGDTVNLTFAGFDVSAAAASDVSTVAGAETAMGAVDAAMALIVTTRATLGAGQNRLESVVSALSVNVQNLSDSRSRIEDADIAVESTNLAKASIINQAATAMLAQANQRPADVLSLLR
ncbi:MAG: flagellin N-terminal helical domain-containing protein [Allosphingosinicella sp.]